MRHPWFLTRKASKLIFVCFQLAGEWHHPASWKQSHGHHPASFEAMQHIILRKLWLSKKKSNNKSIRLTYSMWNHYYQHWNHTNMFLPRSHGVWFDFPSIHNLKQRKKERDLLTNTQVLKQGIYFFLKYGK